MFFGFDSFLGLPEDWTPENRKGKFDLQGAVPIFLDSRISVIKGYFQDTLPDFLHSFKISGKLIIHFDADLYASTLYCLLELDKLKIPYYAFFDEFTGHETRALYNYH